MREKDQHIEQLMKEREMERSEVTRAAAQADEAEHQLAVLQRRFQAEQEANQSKLAEMEKLLAASDLQKAALTSQVDDLQFRLDEEAIARGDLEVQ